MRRQGVASRQRPRIEVVPNTHEFVPQERRDGRKYIVFALGWRLMSSHRYGDQKQRYAGGLTLRQFFAIACLFWSYVALSNVLYAYGMSTGIANITTESPFAPWDARVLKHLLLLPFLLVSYW